MKSRPSFGIRARLFIAFGAVASMTMIATVAAWLSFSRLSGSLERIADAHVPAMTMAAQLAETGGAIIATAPALVSAADEREEKAVWSELTVLLARMSSLVGKMDGSLVDGDSRSSLRNLIERISDNLKSLRANMDRRFALLNRKSETIDRLNWLHADFLGEVEPLIDEAQFNIQWAMDAAKNPADSESSGAGFPRLAREMAKRNALLEINASGNRVTALLTRVANADSEEEIQFTGYLLKGIGKSLKDALSVMQGLASAVSLRQLVLQMLSYTDSEGSLLDIRSRELQVAEQGRRLIAANRQLVERLKHVIQQRVAALESATEQTADRSKRSIMHGKYFLAAIAAISLIIAIVAGWIYVGRNIVSRITALGKSMRAIAEGDLRAEVPVGGHDEITEMAKALLVFRDTAIEVEEANAEAIIDNTMAGLVATNRTGVIEFFNPSAEMLFGYRSEEVIGRNLTSLMAEEHRDGVADVIRHASLRSPEYDAEYIETVGLRADGTRFPMDLAVRDVRQRQRDRLIVTAHDVTERKHAQQLLEQRVYAKTEDLRAANLRLRNEITKQKKTEAELRNTQDELVQAGKLAALGKISASIVHELNQPLAAIRSYAHNGSILLERGRHSEARDNLERISAMSERMAGITTHLKTFARRPSMVEEEVDLANVAADALSFFQNRISKEEISVEVRFPRKGLLVMGEGIRLEQVFINLLANAFDAMSDVEEKTLRISGRRRNERGIVEIADSGCGIDETDLRRVFDPFYTSKEPGRGMGLGLSISSKIISDFGGSIRARSTPGKGSTFIFSLPLVEGRNAAK